MKAYLALFLSARGFIDRRTFQHGLLLIVVANIVLFWAIGMVLSSSGLRTIDNLSLLASLLTLWPSIAVYAKRLRTAGRSAWDQGPARAFMAMGILLLVLFGTRAIDHADEVLRAAVSVTSILSLLIGAVMDLILIFNIGLRGPDQPREAVDAVFD